MEIIEDTYEKQDHSYPPFATDGGKDYFTHGKSCSTRHDSFQSATAVIEEVQDTALTLVEKEDTDTNLSGEDDIISVEEAVALWKKLGVTTDVNESEVCLKNSETTSGGIHSGKYITVTSNPMSNVDDAS